MKSVQRVIVIPMFIESSWDYTINIILKCF